MFVSDLLEFSEAGLRRVCRRRSDAVDHGRAVHADCDRLEAAVLLHGRFQSGKRAVYFGVEYFSSS